ncbi:MAG: hypothetical protein MPL62_14645, partial [Alphaproteobacteria bacterium]|nr:hypothetical protein [Alphaproteobacteria bacterium]
MIGKGGNTGKSFTLPNKIAILAVRMGNSPEESCAVRRLERAHHSKPRGKISGMNFARTGPPHCSASLHDNADAVAARVAERGYFF